MAEETLAAKIRSISSLEELQGFVAHRISRAAPMDSATQSMIALRKIELQYKQKPISGQF